MSEGFGLYACPFVYDIIRDNGGFVPIFNRGVQLVLYEGTC